MRRALRCAVRVEAAQRYQCSVRVVMDGVVVHAYRTIDNLSTGQHAPECHARARYAIDTPPPPPHPSPCRREARVRSAARERALRLREERCACGYAVRGMRSEMVPSVGVVAQAR